MQLVRSRTSHILAIENITARQCAMNISSNRIKQMTADTVDKCSSRRTVALAIKSNLAVVTTLSEQIELLEKRLQEDMGNGKKKGEGNTGNGNKYPAWAFVEAANFVALRFNAEAKRFYERKKAKTNTAAAIKALAHKLARADYYILKENKPFDATRCFA